MKHAELISNLDYLRAENRLAEYVDQFYFFFEQAVQEQNIEMVDKLLTTYLREVFYTDNRTRLHTLMQRVEDIILQPQYKMYQPMFYLVKGNLHYFSINFEQANAEFKKAISFATEMQNFHVLSIALNNMLASKIDEEAEHIFDLTTLPAILQGMNPKTDKMRQYMLLLVHIEMAILEGKYTYAQTILQLLRQNLAHSDLPSRESLQFDMIQLRIYVESGQYESFFELLASFSDEWSFQYDLQTATYQYAMQAARGMNDEALFTHYEQLLAAAKEAANTVNAQLHGVVDPGREQLMQYMVPFATLKKKAQRHITRNQLPSYCVVMFHIEQEEITDVDMKRIQASIHDVMLPALQPQLFSCTMVSEQKMLYLFKMTEAQMLMFLRTHIKPVIQQYRDALHKQFRVIISYVQNDLYGYETFEQTLQYGYALLYYARHNGEGALLNA